MNDKLVRSHDIVVGCETECLVTTKQPREDYIIFVGIPGRKFQSEVGRHIVPSSLVLFARNHNRDVYEVNTFGFVRFSPIETVRCSLRCQLTSRWYDRDDEWLDFVQLYD